MQIVLASTSPTRRLMLERAGIPFTAVAPRLDEESLRIALAAEGASPRDIADALAEAKARKVAEKGEGGLILGCDQILDVDGRINSKAADAEELRGQLLSLRGRSHRLYSAAVLYEAGEPVWRHVGHARLTMRPFSDSLLSAYLARVLPDALNSVGGYRIEAEGIQLFSRIEGDHFTILGLPLLEVLSYLQLRGVIES